MTAVRKYAILIVLVALLSATCGRGPPGSNPKLLVVLEALDSAQKYSQLLRSLSDRGYELTIRGAKEASPSDLTLYSVAGGEYEYGGVILLCPRAKNMQKLLPSASLLQFVDNGHSLFVTADADYSSYTRDVVRSIGVDLDQPRSRVIDHQNIFPSLDSGDHTYIVAGGKVRSVHLFGDNAGASEGDIVFHGPGASLFSDNELVESVIWGSGSSYSYIPSIAVNDSPHESGSATVLAAVLSTRVGSRASYFGSIDALSDAIFDAAGEAHREALQSLASWTFGHSGVLRTRNLRYESDRRGSAENGLRVKDTVQFSIDVQQWDGTQGIWRQFEADDIQVEFVMLNPWVRTRLRPSRNGINSTYFADIPVPDQIGIYKFVVSYHRPGVSALEVSHVVPIRPFLHNEYPRFILMAYPYYGAAFLMLSVVFVLGIVFLFGAESVVNINSANNEAQRDSGIVDKRKASQAR